MVQHIRRSQFVYTYGPGSFIEGTNGPRIILRPDIGLFCHINPEDFEISDQRISQGLLQGGRVFRLPSNAELRKPQGGYIYRTRAFPEWKLCPKPHKNQSGDTFSVLYRGTKCPHCGSDAGHREAIRFVRACPMGHLDDVDWPKVVHAGKEPCSVQHFEWLQTGSSLSQVIIRCPRPQCNAWVNLGQAYKQPWSCSGRFPEAEQLGASPSRPGCNCDAFIIQRQAANLRIPVLQTLFTIPPRASRLHLLLQQRPVSDVIIADGGIGSKQDLMNKLKNLVNNGRLARSVYEEIDSSGSEDIEQAIQDIRKSVSPQYGDLLSEEFDALLEASLKGYPPQRSAAGTVLFEVNPHKVKLVSGPRHRMRFRVVPLDRLRTVTVQVGYRREVGGSGSSAQLVDVSFTDQNGDRWFPGTEFLGEGIFVMLEEGAPDFACGAGAMWKQVWQHLDSDKYSADVFRVAGRHDELHPLFVWWHTLSHFLIRVISTDSGYSSASIRERVYVNADEEKGGLVLYATQPGSEGSLGGLISLVPRFEDILRQAIDAAEICSNDPLCLDNHFKAGHYNGPSCYGCALLSETSCEHRNLWLDREVLLESAP